MRLFLGIELTDPLRAEIDRVQSLLRPCGADVRWVDPHGAHLTLHFLGEIDETRAADLDSALPPQVEETPEMSLQLDGIGAFPDERRPRVLWVGCQGDLRSLASLHDSIGEALTRLSIGIEARRFHPHVTIGRVRSARNLATLSTRLAKLRDARLGDLPVHDVTLFRSELTSAGSRYSVRSRYRLGGGVPPSA